MGRKNRGNTTDTSSQDDTTELVGQVADNDETSQAAPEGVADTNGNSNEDSGNVGGSGTELGTENADEQLAADLPPADSQDLAPVIDNTLSERALATPYDIADGEVVQLTDPEPPKLADILSTEEQAAIAEVAAENPVAEEPLQEVVVTAESVTIAQDGAVLVNVPDPVEATEVEKPATVSLRKKLTGKLEADALAAFDQSALTLFDEKRVMPNKTSHLEWPVDIRRTKNMATWTDGALVDWANGEIKTPPGILAETLHDELYRRYRLPGNWTEAAAIEFINTGKKPEATANGVLLEDRARSAAPLTHWTFKEIKAALLGEIDTLNHKTEDLVKVLRQRMGLSNATSQDKILDSLNNGTDEASMDNTILDAKLAEYKQAMTSKGANLSAASAGEAQVVLYNTIRSVLQRDPQQFHEGWLKLLNFVNTEYNVLFVPEKARKGWAQMKLSVAAGRTFEDILSLLINTRQPATRAQDARQYKLERILQYVTEPERQNVINFYQQLGQ